MLFKCKKCGHTAYKLEERGTQTALLCEKCGFWQKWISKEEVYRWECKAVKPISELPDTLIINGVKYVKAIDELERFEEDTL